MIIWYQIEEWQLYSCWVDTTNIFLKFYTFFILFLVLVGVRLWVVVVINFMTIWLIPGDYVHVVILWEVRRKTLTS